MTYKIAPSGAKGNLSLLKKFGGKEGPLPKDYPKGYATGGAVKGYATGGAPMMDTEGAPARPNLSRPGRKISKGKDAGKKGTNVNVVIMQKPDGGEKGAPPMPPMAGPPPADMGPPPGASPMPPMRAKGGRVDAKQDKKMAADDDKSDKKMVAKMIHKHEAEDHKGSPMTKFKAGGKIRGIKDGAGGGMGRMEKIKAYGK